MESEKSYVILDGVKYGQNRPYVINEWPPKRLKKYNYYNMFLIRGWKIRVNRDYNREPTDLGKEENRMSRDLDNVKFIAALKCLQISHGNGTRVPRTVGSIHPCKHVLLAL